MSEEKKSSDVFTTLPTSNSVSIKELKWVICIDISGSTEHHLANGTVLDSEIKFVNDIYKQLDVNNKFTKFVKWDNSALLFNYENINDLKPSGGTNPTSIFNKNDILQFIKQADALMIITDGNIDQHEVTNFGLTMLNYGYHFKAVIGMIIGTNPYIKPEDVDVSVLIPAMLSNSCILYQKALVPPPWLGDILESPPKSILYQQEVSSHENPKTYVMWSSGSFKKMCDPVDIVKNMTWDQVTTMNTDHVVEVTGYILMHTNNLMNVVVDCCDPELVQEMDNEGYIPLGMNMFFNPDNLLEYQPTFEELKQYSFDRICTYFKIINKYKLLLDWFKIQMTRLINEILIDNDDDKINFECLVDKMSKSNNYKCEQESNMSLFIKARNQTLARLYIASDDDIEFALDNPRAIELMQFFRNMIKIMNEDVKMAWSYKASSMSSMRYTKFSSCSSSLKESVYRVPPKITATFEEPVLWNHQFLKVHKDYVGKKQNCSICCEESIPFILLRKKIKWSKTAEIDLSPFNYYSPEIYCSKCADFFFQRGKDPFNVNCVGSFPIILLDKISEESRNHYLKSFSKYVNIIIMDEKPKQQGIKRIIADSVYTVMTPINGLLYYTGISGLLSSLSLSKQSMNKSIKNDEDEDIKIDPTQTNILVQYNKIYQVLIVLSENIKKKLLNDYYALHNKDIEFYPKCSDIILFINTYIASLRQYVTL